MNHSNTQLGLFYTANPNNTGGLTQYTNPQLNIQQRQLSPTVAPDHVRLRMHYVGICGTDIDLMRTDISTGFVKSSVPLAIEKAGRLLGHEGIGQVIATGSDNSALSVGDWVVPASVYGCGHCHLCLGDHPNQCVQAKLLGTQIDGIFADITDIPSRLCMRVTNYIQSDKDLIALTGLEPAATGLQACEIAALKQTDRVIVFGAGPIGAYCALIAKLIFGCRYVAVIEPIQFRRNYVSKYVDYVNDSINQDILNDGYDVLIEASGDLNNMRVLFRSLLPAARVVLLARSKQSLNFDFVDHLITNKISITGCRGQLGGYMQQVAQYYFDGRLPLGDFMNVGGKGIEALSHLITNSQELQHSHCKVLVQL